ncbi:AraC family transcriptional regulator [Maricurvus nonylphenolicus]|uniref:AraC family transcriptional regulator n=1 Tax=Maricurvus nonylphenolicus TaxID=1008307 RepID=UPI0036F2592A
MYNHTSLPIWLNTVRSILIERGKDLKDLSPLLRDGDWLQKDEVVERADVEAIAEAWRLAAEVCDDPAIGIHAAKQYFQPASWRTLGLAVLCSQTLRDALDRIARYGEVLSNVAIPSVYEEEGVLIYEMKMILNGTSVGHEAVDFGFASIVKLLRMVYPGELPMGRIEMQRPAVSNPEEFEAFFGCSVAFGSSKNIIAIRSQYVDQPLPGANSELARMQDQLTAQYVEKFSDNSFALQVKNEIIGLLPGGDPSQQAIAERLSCSQRNLQRRLQDEGTNFTQLLTDIRQQLARLYLQDSDRSLSEIAYLLGFSDHSNFTRAFKRWFDQSPTEYRQQR